MPGIVWVIIVVLILIVVFSGNRTAANKKSNISKSKKKNFQSNKTGANIKQERVASIQKDNARQMTHNPEHQSMNNNDDIIDVTGNSVELKQLCKYEKDIPYWRHQYVYSHSEIHRATSDQQNFYNEFKYRFLRNEFLDVEGNSNYYFILLFDLYNNDFPVHKDIGLLEAHVMTLASTFLKRLLMRGHYC